MPVAGLTAVVFDTFGTVMKRQDSIIAEFRSCGQRRGLDMDWEAFVDEWKTAYRPELCRTAKWPWTRVDQIMNLDEILPKYGLDRLSEEEAAAVATGSGRGPTQSPALPTSSSGM